MWFRKIFLFEFCILIVVLTLSKDVAAGGVYARLAKRCKLSPISLSNQNDFDQKCFNMKNRNIFYNLFIADRPLNDYPIFMKREIDFARQIVDKPEGSELVLLNKILNGATRADKGGLALDLSSLKEIMNDLDIDSIPELENLLSQERKLLNKHIRSAKNSYRPSNSLYANHILAMP